MHFIKQLSGHTKITDIVPVCKNQDVNEAKYRPITLLLIISTIFEKTLYEQLDIVTNKIFSPKLCGFRKGHSSQMVS